MTTLQIHSKTDNKGVLHFDIPLDKPNMETDVQIVVTESSQIPSSYDFSGVSGRLIWKGDAVAHQRQLRNEW